VIARPNDARFSSRCNRGERLHSALKAFRGEPEARLRQASKRRVVVYLVNGLHVSVDKKVEEDVTA
jgi:hypothetical protein